MSCHLFISPHLDDVVLSCGGTIASLTREGERVVIVTTMAGEPPLGLPSTPLLEAIRARWQSGQNLLAMRRMEDARAAHVLGAQIIHLPVFESIFRMAPGMGGARLPLYATEASVYGALQEGDDAHLMLFEMGCPCEDVSIIYAPLCADTHIDHRIARDWALKLTCSGSQTPMRFYEEFPAADDNASGSNRPKVRRALQDYRAQIPPYSLSVVINVLPVEAVQSKLDAMRCYQSHIGVLWQDVSLMEQQAKAFMSASATPSGGGAGGTGPLRGTGTLRASSASTAGGNPTSTTAAAVSPNYSMVQPTASPTYAERFWNVTIE